MEDEVADGGGAEEACEGEGVGERVDVFVGGEGWDDCFEGLCGRMRRGRGGGESRWVMGGERS